MIEKWATSPISATASKTCSPIRWTGLVPCSIAESGSSRGATAIARSLRVDTEDGSGTDVPASPPPGLHRRRSGLPCRPLLRVILGVSSDLGKVNRRVAAARSGEAFLAETQRGECKGPKTIGPSIPEGRDEENPDPRVRSLAERSRRLSPCNRCADVAVASCAGRSDHARMSSDPQSKVRSSILTNH